MNGVVYVAYGEPARSSVLRSVASLRQYQPDLPVAVVADRPLDGLDCIMREDDHVGARYAKLAVADLTPFERTCYLDADTTVVHSLEEGFRLLDAFDLALAMDGKHTVHYVAHMTSRAPFGREEVAATVKAVGTSMITLHNCGLMFFKKCARVRGLYRVWQEEWERFGKRDQLAFVRALHRCPVRMVTLPHCWNTGYAPKAERVLHHWGDARRKGAP